MDTSAGLHPLREGRWMHQDFYSLQGREGEYISNFSSFEGGKVDTSAGLLPSRKRSWIHQQVYEGGKVDISGVLLPSKEEMWIY